MKKIDKGSFRYLDEQCVVKSRGEKLLRASRGETRFNEHFKFTRQIVESPNDDVTFHAQRSASAGVQIRRRLIARVTPPNTDQSK